MRTLKFYSFLKNIKKFLYRVHFFHCSIPYEHQILGEDFIEKDKKTYFTIRATGMNIYPRYAAQVLANDDEILKNFHPKDVKRIIKAYLADQEFFLTDEVKYQVESKIKKKGEFIFTVVSNDNLDCAKKMTAREIINNKKFLFSFSKHDIADICVDAGIENSDYNLLDLKILTKVDSNVKRLFEIKNKKTPS